MALKKMVSACVLACGLLARSCATAGAEGVDAAASPAPAAAGPGPVVKATRLNRDDGHGGVGEAVNAFATTDRKLHFHVELDSLRVGQTTAKWVFRGVDTEAGKDLEVASYATSGLIVNEVDGAVSLPRDWPAGTYEADLFINDRLATKIPYEIRRAAGAIEVVSVSLYRDDGKGNAGEKVTKFKPSDHVIHVEVATKGLGPQSKIVWIYKAVDTTAGKNVRIAAVPGAVTDANVNILTSKCELPRDWPKGTYQILLVVGDKLVRTIDFGIE